MATTTEKTYAYEFVETDAGNRSYELASLASGTLLAGAVVYCAAISTTNPPVANSYVAITDAVYNTYTQGVTRLGILCADTDASGAAQSCTVLVGAAEVKNAKLGWNDVGATTHQSKVRGNLQAQGVVVRTNTN